MSEPKTPQGGGAELDRLRWEFAAALDEREAAHREQTGRLLTALLGALDSFDRLLADGPPPADGEGVQAYHQSVGLVARQLDEAVRTGGLEPIGLRGETADPATHQVIDVREPGPPGTAEDEVLEVARRGYRYHGRVLRAAQVVVAGPAPVPVPESLPAPEADREPEPAPDREPEPEPEPAPDPGPEPAPYTNLTQRTTA
ncbi:nucleotide exchange factor GrpE [Streptomyces armeniacus]|uniref:Protein GrpE n=1 Tax=Streptomyces armeniacus TaxID=83291 RepID=A0A345XZ58_9ACTN|nr:nucleotide exchange factor GrpE [Streptomyces armeniacus]